MIESRKLVPLCCAALMALSGAALADGYEYEGKAMAPPEEGRKFTYSFNIAGTSDYIFRGISQTARDPALQGGADFSYGSLYLGVWGSGVDFEAGGPNIVNSEIDIYGGYTPSWDTHTFLGKVDFDFGVIYYWYPNGNDTLNGGELDYVELKAGYTTQLWSFLIPGLSSGTTVFYSPEYSGEIGAVWTIESTYSWEGHEIRGITPTISGLLGWQTGEDTALYGPVFNDDEYYYWNVGLALAVEKITFDFRYWDTNISNDGKAAFGTADGFCDGPTFQCDETFVFTVKVEVP